MATQAATVNRADFSLVNRVALVTGGGGGLGGGMAIALAAAGADIALFDVAPAGMEAVAAQIEGLGRRCESISGDLRERLDIARMVQTVEASYGRLDIAVNSAGINIRKPALDAAKDKNATEEKDLEERFDKALKSIRARAEEMNITDEDIDAEIRAVREGK